MNSLRNRQESISILPPISPQPPQTRPPSHDRPWSSVRWCDYFRANSLRQSNIPWNLGAKLDETEKKAITTSIREFQAGENSEGNHLTRKAAEHAADSADFTYVRAIRDLIGEEQRHARELGRFMIAARIPVVETTYVDQMFRGLRKLAGLELMIAVLLAAEIIAQVYYRALRDATKSEVLKKICERILRDEVYHVRFQCERLAILRARRYAPALLLTHCFQAMLFLGALLLVGIKHSRTLRQGGFNFKRWWKAGWHKYGRAKRLMDPRGYGPELKLAIERRPQKLHAI